MMRDIYKKASQVKKTSEGVLLERRIGEGSFVGLERTFNTPEEMVEWLRHLYAYEYAESFVEGKCVLDVGCGTGYGIHELSTKARVTVGVDIWKEGIYYCHQKYGNENYFLIASGLNIPFRDKSFDIVSSFQVIEHIDPKMVIEYLKEVRRVLKDGGIFIVSTPNRRLRLLPFQKPWNPDHKREYDAKELENMLKRVFEKVEILGLFATKDAYLVEYKRVKQKPLFVYVINPAVLIAKRILPASFLNILRTFMTERKFNGRSKLQQYNFLNFSLKDFQISRQNLKACMDVYGICVKSNN